MEQNGTLWNGLEHFGTLQEGERMQDNNTGITEQERETIAPDVIYQNNIYALVDDVKELPQFKGLTVEELKNNKSFFPLLIDYIYNNYIGDLLGNKDPNKKVVYKDIQCLDNIFNIYKGLVYTYKWNNRPSLLEFSILTGISTDTFYNWLKGSSDNNSISGDGRKHITSSYADVVKKWQTVSERALVDGNGDTIKEIFLLKAKYNYKENSDIQITVNHKPLVSADELPRLIDLKEQ